MFDAGDVLDFFGKPIRLQGFELSLELAELPIEFPLPVVGGNRHVAALISLWVEPEPLQNPAGPAVVNRVYFGHPSSLSSRGREN